MSAHPLARVIAGTARIVSGAHVIWLDSRPEPGQTVYFANHTSHLDFIVLWASLPAALREHTRPIAAQDYWENGLRRMLAVDVFNALLVRRRQSTPAEPGNAGDARDTIANIAAAMGEHASLIIFPEGTRGTGEEVAPFKSGLYYLCREKPGLRLVPAYIHNLNRILPKGEFLPVPFISKITFGAPMALEPAESKADFLLRARGAVCRLKPA